MYLPPPSNNTASASHPGSEDKKEKPISLFILIAAIISLAMFSLVAGTSLYFIVDILHDSGAMSWSINWFNSVLIVVNTYVIRSLFKTIERKY